MKLKLVLFSGLLFLLSACSSDLFWGDPQIKVENVSYEPKITVEGFIFPGKPVDRIRVFRNFRLDADLNDTELLPRNVVVNVIDDSDKKVHPLKLNIPDDISDIQSYYYYDENKQLIIEPGKSYTIEVSAIIEDKQLFTRSTTTVPLPGLKIVDINYTSLQFAKQKENGDLESFELLIERSPGTDFYVNSVRALDTTFADFIKNHVVGEFDREDFEEDFDRFSYDTNWIQNTPLTAGQSNMRIGWFNFYFYGDYEIIVYAVDRNYKEFLQTFSRVQEFDGNFHEAKFNFEGDGIGVFGSAISDTIYVTVIR